MNYTQLPTFDDEGFVQVVVETPRGTRAKIVFDATAEIFRFSRPLMLGVAYPFDWGFVPSTCAPDGDPLDAMIYHDVATYPGVVVACKPIGLLKLTQKEKGRPRQENDRLIVVPSHEERWDDATALEQRVREELEHFFEVVVSYTGKRVDIRGWQGPEAARTAIARARRATVAP